MDVMTIVQDITIMVTKSMINIKDAIIVIVFVGNADRIFTMEGTTDIHSGIIPGHTSIILVLEIDVADLVLVIEAMGAGKYVFFLPKS